MKNGENGILAVPTYAPIAVSANRGGAAARRAASRVRSGRRARPTPLAPRPNSAIDTTRNAKWYQIEAEKMRMNVTWNSRVAAEIRKIPACAANGGAPTRSGSAAARAGVPVARRPGVGALGRGRVIMRDYQAPVRMSRRRPSGAAARDGSRAWARLWYLFSA